jgi:hypothetical protein
MFQKTTLWLAFAVFASRMKDETKIANIGDTFREVQKRIVTGIILALIMLAAIAARAWLLFSMQYVPGVNGAYYLVQVRSLLERGTLSIFLCMLFFIFRKLLGLCISQFD